MSITRILLISQIILASFVIGEKIECDKYVCGGLNTDECAKAEIYSENLMTYYLNPCNDTKICPLNFHDQPDICSLDHVHPTKFPGEFCKIGLECLSGNCLNNTCKGVEAGFKCTSDSVCDAGLYCNELNECEEAKYENLKCDYKTKCLSTFVCNKGVCTKILSLENGSEASAPLACKSYFIHQGVCFEGPKLQKEEQYEDTEGPIPCNNETYLCSYVVDGKLKINQLCQCGMADTRDSFCSPGKGDIDSKDYAEYVHKLDPKACHISRGPLCQFKELKEMGVSFYKALTIFTKLNNWVSIHNNPTCVKDMLNHDYWYAINAIEKDEEQEEFGLYVVIVVAIGTVILAGVALFLLFKCKKKNDNEETSQDTTGEIKLEPNATQGN